MKHLFWGILIGVTLTLGLYYLVRPTHSMVLCVILHERIEPPFTGVGMFNGKELLCRIQ